MTIAIGQNQERGIFDLIDDWLKKDRFVFVGWSGILLFPTAYLAAKFNSSNPKKINYSISSIETYKKNNAILSAGKTKPTIGTRIEGKNAAAIFLS